MKYLHLLFGLTTFIPGVYNIFKRGGGRTDSARYCYSVWLRHLSIIHKYGTKDFPKIVAELGPGESIGIGLAALISGVDKYYAFDVVEYADLKRNMKIFDELVTLFNNREDIPGEDEIPRIKPNVDSLQFPKHILSDEILDQSLNKDHIEKIRNSILDAKGKHSLIQYKVPWYDSGSLENNSVDIIYSQAVLEHVDDLEDTYQSIWKWLKPKAFTSHQIDFKCHRTADEWNGHWTYSDFRWKLIRGGRPYLLNREPHSTHIYLLKKTGFSIVSDNKINSDSKFKQNDLAPRFKNISDEDLTTSGVYILACKE